MTESPATAVADAPWRGVFSILCTPFHSDGTVDWASLRREVLFCLDAGARGLVCNANASEFWTLTDDERRRVAETIVKEVASQVPTIVGVSSDSSAVSALFGQHAAEIGADAVMAMPARSQTAVPVDAVSFYGSLAEAVELPIFIQNHDAPLGTRMPPDLVADIANSVPGADWIKEETIPSGHAISLELELCTDKLRGIMGGLAGRHLIDEYRRGVAGTMPACESTDLHAAVWSLLEAGDEKEARAVFHRVLPLLNYEAVTSGAYKTTLHWRGVLETDYMRNSMGNPLDGQDRHELREILRSMGDLFTVHPPADPRPVPAGDPQTASQRAWQAAKARRH
jgi:4-hydroxy-tetrahydrodipicolinate synthase